MDFLKGIGDFFGGLFGKKKKQNEINNLQQSSQPNFQPNTLSSQTDLGSTKFNPSTNFQAKPDYSFKTTALTPSTKPVSDATDFSKDNTSGLKLDLNNRFKPNGNKFTLGGSSRIENTAVHEDDINNTIKQINDRYHNERDSLGRFWGSFTGDTDRRDKELRRKILTDEMKKITDGLGSNPDGSYKRDYTDDEAYKMATLQLAMRHGIDRQPLKAFVPINSIDKKPINSNTMGEWGLATARTIKNMTDGEDGIGGLVGNALLGKRKTDEGFNFGRFITDLPAGMIAGGAGIGSGISDALSGKRMQDDGTIKDLNGLQRFGAGADAAISAFGLPTGASGKLLSSIFKRGAKQAVSETTKTGLKDAAKRITKELAKGAASEGLEEGVQQIAQNLSDTNNYDNNGNFKIENLLNQVPESAALGALGGGIMGGASLGINAGKSKLGELSQNIRQNIDQRINPQTNPVQNAVAKIEANNSLKYSLSQNQENFFKDSKIRDANGDLMSVYHGTNQDFNQFEDSKIQKTDLGRGFYFTDNKDIANNYAEIRANERGGKGKVMETFLNVKNPFDLNYQPREAALDYLTYYFANNGQTNAQAVNSAKTLLDMSLADGDIVDGDYSSVFNTKEPEFEKWAKSKGYDGIVVPGGDQDSGLSGNAYVVFEPNQIKSTKNLNPTDSPDIRYKNDATQDIQSFSEQNLRKIIGNELYSVKLNVGLNDNGKLFYTINGIKKAPEFHNRNLSGGDTNTLSQSSPDVKMKLENTNTDRFGNQFSEQEIPVSQLRRSQEFQPRTTASGKGTSDSVFKHGYNEGMVDQPMLVRKNSDGTYEVLGGHSRTEGLERRAKAGLENPETVKARVYDNLTDKQALQVSQAANQGGQYESILDMAKSISDARNAGIEPSVQRQNMVKGYSMDDYDALYKILSNDRNLQGLVFEGAISQEDMLSIARTSRKLNFEPERTQNLVREAYSRGDFNKKGVESVMKALSTKEHNKEYSESLNGFSFMDDMEALDSQQEILDAQKAIKKQALLDNSLDRVINNFDSFSSDQQAKILEMINNEKLNNSSSINHEDKNTTIEPVMDNQKSDLQTEVNRTDTEQEEIPRQDATDNEVENYVKDQVENQKKSTSAGLMQKIKDVKDFLRHHLSDDSTAYEQYLAKGHDKESKLAREKLKEDIRNDIDKVRSSDMIAQQFIRDNGLAELGKMSTKDLNEFQQYLIARRHAADLHKQGINTGRDLDMDLAIIDKYKKKFTEQEKIYRNFNKQLLNYMEDNGLISKELHNKLNQNTAYTPYQRLMDDVSSFTGHSQQLGNLNSEQVIKKMKGSDRTILNPIEATMSNTMRIINEGQRNIAARKIAENAFSENRLKDGQKPRAGYDTLNFMENGKKVSYEVPKMVASEMKRLNRVLPEGVEKVINVLSMPAKTLRGGATSLNPIFAASNLIRDQLQTTITGNIGANIKGTPKALLATFGFGEKADNLRAELSRQGIIGSEYRQTYGYKQGDLMAELQKEHHLSKKAADRLKHPIDALNDLIGRTEYFTRAQQYFGTDGDITTKSQAARNNTLNFSRGGEAIMVVNRVVPFLNAGMQGGRQMINQLVKRPARTALALAAWAGIAMAAKGISESDEKKKELYDRVSDYEKKTNLVLFDKDAKYNPETGRIDGLVKIPIPQFLYPITDSMNNIKDSPDALLKTASNIFEVFTGLDAENPVNQLTPTAIKPFIEAATNTNTFTKQDIVSDYDKNKLPQDKGAKYTTGAARFLAGLTGVDAPIIDNFIANWSGGLGKDLAKTLTDNPDNQKDGGGIGRIFTEGAYRRFGSAGADSQYKMAVDSGEKLKKQLEGYSDFKNLSKEDQEKVKNAIDSDFKQIGSTFGKLERGDEVKNRLSDRQAGLLQGFNSSQYIEEALKGARQVNKDRLNSENDYEYNEFKKEYEEKSAKGEYSRKSRIDAQNKLKRLEVGKDFTKETRDLYGLGKDDLRNLIESSEDGNKVLDNVIAYGDALVRAGIASRNKFRDRYGNISLSGTSRSGRSGGSRSGGGTPSYKMDTMSLIRGALKSSRGKSSVSFNRKAATKANTRAIKRLNSSKIKR